MNVDCADGPATNTSSRVRYTYCLECGKLGTWRGFVVDISDPDRPGFICQDCLRSNHPPRGRGEMNL